MAVNHSAPSCGGVFLLQSHDLHTLGNFLMAWDEPFGVALRRIGLYSGPSTSACRGELSVAASFLRVRDLGYGLGEGGLDGRSAQKES